MTRRISRVHLLALCVALVPTFAPAQQPSFPPVPKPASGRSALPVKALPLAELLSELRRGGYIIYFRHTSTDFSRDDSRSRNDEDCENQRPLTDKGREEARRVGAAIRELNIPVGQVLASPRCRTVETAMLAFNRVEKTAAARGGPARPDNSDRYDGLRKILATPMKPGANLVIASHGNPFYAVAGAPYLAEGEAAIVRPLGSDFEVVARVRANDWAVLAQK